MEYWDFEDSDLAALVGSSISQPQMENRPAESLGLEEDPMKLSSSGKLSGSNNGSDQLKFLCLVDGCRADLSRCREYHRRHRVCELHSKAPVVVVRGEQKRFCQQCSRFHSLVDFDEVKRSCRKRLKGHNQRRRKPKPESFNFSSHFFFSAYKDVLHRDTTDQGTHHHLTGQGDPPITWVVRSYRPLPTTPILSLRVRSLTLISCRIIKETGHTAHFQQHRYCLQLGPRILQFSNQRVCATTNVRCIRHVKDKKGAESMRSNYHHQWLHATDERSPPNSFNGGGDKQFLFLQPNDPKAAAGKPPQAFMCQQQTFPATVAAASPKSTKSCALYLLSSHPTQNSVSGLNHLAQSTVTTTHPCSHDVEDRPVNPEMMFPMRPDGF